MALALLLFALFFGFWYATAKRYRNESFVIRHGGGFIVAVTGTSIVVGVFITIMEGGSMSWLWNIVVFGTGTYFGYKVAMEVQAQRAAIDRDTPEAPRHRPTQFHDDGFDDDTDLFELDESIVEEYSSDPCTIRTTLKLKYTDAGGNRSQRVVDVREYDEMRYGGSLAGICHMRGEWRTFRLDRVNEAIDLETGEVIQDLREYLSALYANSPEAISRRLLDSSYDAIRVLYYVGKADGQFKAAEKAEMLAFCRQVSLNPDLGMDVLEYALSTMQVPSKAAFRQTVGRLAKLEESIRESVIETATRMIATQKTIDPEEQQALDYLKKRLGTDTLATI